MLLFSSEPETRPVASPEGVRRWVMGWVAVMWTVGVAVRAIPILAGGQRLLRTFCSEDGYLMMTIGRNVALGHGMSVSGGTIPTNGTQPLATFVWSLCFALAGGDRVRGIAFIQFVSLVVAAGAALMLRRAGKLLLTNIPWGDITANIAAATWFAAYLCIGHSMNCLETGIYALVVIGAVTLLAQLSVDPTRDWPMRICLGIGLVLGLAFWARNDAVFFIAAVCLTRVFSGISKGWPCLVRRLMETVVFGAVSVLVAAPWLANNLLRFGRLIPISGVAESADARFGQNLYLVPVKLAEYLSVVLGVPNRLEARPEIVVLATVAVGLALAVLARLWTGFNPTQRSATLIVALYGSFLSVYYGLLFGAAHFMSRYLMPLSPFLALFTIALLVHFLTRNPLKWPAIVAGVAGLAAVLGMDARLVRSPDHAHFAAKEWIERNVPDDVWVGAVQTGTIGFFHDRTLNLDGKVSPRALEALIQNRIPEYVVSTPIQYLVDWSGIVSWMSKPAIRDHFVVVVNDPVINLGVLARKDVSKQPPAESASRP